MEKSYRKQSNEGLHQLPTYVIMIAENRTTKGVARFGKTDMARGTNFGIYQGTGSD